jgi:hypothetical protein
MLDLQENILQDACAKLLETIRVNNYPFQLYYHERTLRELNEIRNAIESSLSARRYSPQLSRGFVQYAEARGAGYAVDLHFHRLNAGAEIDVEAFLSRFNHIEELLAANGVKIYRQSQELDTFTKGMYVAEFEHLLKQIRPARPRRYEARDHDVVLWMSLQRMRTSSKSALRSGALLLSNDRALQTFDKRFLMHQTDGKLSPTVVLPHHLLQVLRPLNRVTTNFDERFLAIFAAPEFRTAQSGYDETVSKVMKYLSSFDGVPTETAVVILNDDLLIGRLDGLEAQDEEFRQLVDNAIIAENSTLLSQVTDLQSRLAQTEKEHERTVVRAATELETLRDSTAAVAREKEAASRRAEAELAHRNKVEAELQEERLRREAAEVAARAAQVARERARWGGVVGLGVVGTLVLVRGPEWLGWSAFLKQDRHVAIQILAVVAWNGLMYVLGGGKYRGTALVGVVIAAIIALVSLV